MPENVPLVLVLVGTDHHPFNRMVDWAGEWLRERPDLAVRLVIQYGSTHAPSHGEGRAFIPRAELDELLAAADVVISHGGPSTIVETRRRGLVPIVLARTATLGEHVDDHQQRFARVMAGRKLIRLVESQADLFAAMDQALIHPLLIADGSNDFADPAEAALRLGKLVDEIVVRAQEPRPLGWLRRLTTSAGS